MSLAVFGWLLIIVWGIAAADSASSGLFIQNRIGRHGKPFSIIKLRTVHPSTRMISKVGRFLRQHKIDELPQLINILIGDMSFVGPRPDIAGYYDKLTGDYVKILELRPGLTSEASIKYRNEEKMLASHPNPTWYNDNVIFPNKVEMNLTYFYNHSFFGDIKIIIKTVINR